MAIGLSSDQMFDVVLGSVVSRLQSLSGQLQAAHHGENPQWIALADMLGKQYPGIPPETFPLLGELLLSLLDAVAANNQALAQSVPHVELNP